MKKIALIVLTPALAFALCAASFAASGGGNGSSGIGNLEVEGNLAAQVSLSQPVVKKGDELVDAQTGEKLIKIDRVERARLEGLYGFQLVDAKLGAVKGFEYQPTRAGGAAGEQNLWIVCGTGQDLCVRLTPLSRTNPKIPNLIGALTKKAE